MTTLPAPEKSQTRKTMLIGFLMGNVLGAPAQSLFMWLRSPDSNAYRIPLYGSLLIGLLVAMSAPLFHQDNSENRGRGNLQMIGFSFGVLVVSGYVVAFVDNKSLGVDKLLFPLVFEAIIVACSLLSVYLARRLTPALAVQES